MAGDIDISPDEAREAANDCRTCAQDSQQAIQALTSRISYLDPRKGSWKQSWDEKYPDWTQSAEQMMSALEDLGTWLQNVGDTLEETDTQLGA